MKIFSVTLIFISGLVFAMDPWYKNDDWSIKPGLHLRVRYDVQSDECKDPTGHKMSGTKYKYGPHPSQFFDIRTKFWIDIASKSLGLTSRLSLGNRMHYYTSDWEKVNNNTPGHHTGPDTLSIMEAWIRIAPPDCDGLQFTFGRFPLTLGNGMILRDGIPGDWQNHFNGAMLQYAQDNNSVRFFALYNYWRDPLAMDMRWHRTDYTSRDGRALTQGNILTLGIYNTHKFSNAFKAETYYFFNNVKANRHGRRERAMPAKWDECGIHTLGARIYGDIMPALSYSGEAAQQFGYWHKSGDASRLTGNMLDLRLKWKPADAVGLSPDLESALTLSYTHWSGNDAKSKHYQGWYAPNASYDGLFGGEQVSNKGGVPCGALWTNLHAFHADFEFKPIQKLTTNFGSTYFVSDERSATGRHVGTTLYTRASYKFTKQFEAKLILSHMFYGDYYPHDHNRGAFWGRIELNLFF